MLLTRSILNLWRFRLAGIFQKRRLDYISMGLGIEARYERCHIFWAQHIRLTQGIVAKALNGPDPKVNCAVHGAGRLLDVDLKELSEKCSSVTLFDIDPFCKSLWDKEIKQKGFENVKGEICDLTGVVDLWDDELNKAPKLEVSEAELLESLPFEVSVGYKEAILLSVNVLSQLPVYWKGRVRKKKYPWTSEETDRFELRSSELLQKIYLRNLNRSSADIIVMIYDKSFNYFQSDSCQWEVEPAVFCSVAEELSDFQLAHEEEWFWDIAPQGIEEKDYGYVHEVCGQIFRRR